MFSAKLGNHPSNDIVRRGARNEPNIHVVRQEANPDHWQGSELSVTILGSWQYYRAKARAFSCLLELACIWWLCMVLDILLPPSQGQTCQCIVDVHAEA